MIIQAYPALAPAKKGRWSGKADQLSQGKKLYESGMKCAEIAQDIGCSANTVEVLAKKWGWERPSPHCAKCEASVPLAKRKNKAQPRECDQCRRARHRARKAQLTPEQVRAYRQREYANKGRVLLSREEWYAKQRGTSPRRNRPLVQLGRFRHHGEPPTTREGALEIVKATLVRLLDVRCADDGVSRDAVEYKAKYRVDEVFRQREKLRSSGKRWGNRADGRDDGTLTKEVVRKLFAKAKTCPYCWQPMKAQDKSLDHMEPLSLGGWHSIDNVMVCCLRCNVKKHTTPYAEWLERIPEPCQRKLAERAA
jgi:5-methylcytosine-specific restriction endonuclease McrA